MLNINYGQIVTWSGKEFPILTQKGSATRTDDVPYEIRKYDENDPYPQYYKILLVPTFEFRGIHRNEVLKYTEFEKLVNEGIIKL